MKKTLFYICLLITYALIVVQTAFSDEVIQPIPQTTFAKENMSISHNIEYQKVDKKYHLTNFLNSYNSPLVENVDMFLEVSEKYDIDYRLLPAIACVESGCGKAMIQGSHNAWGWGGGYIKFNNYNEAITKIAEGMDKGYFKKGRLTPEQIGPVYAPPSKTWAAKVRLFMNKIEKAESIEKADS